MHTASLPVPPLLLLLLRGLVSVPCTKMHRASLATSPFCSCSLVSVVVVSGPVEVAEPTLGALLHWKGQLEVQRSASHAR